LLNRDFPGIEQQKIPRRQPKGIPLRSTPTSSGTSGTGILAGLTLLALASCARPHVAPPVAAAPVGHVYATRVAVPPPASERIRITPAQHEMFQQAFNVIGLKSDLVVGALACNQQDRYDTFMRQFQPYILAEQHVMDSYFHRIGGYRGQAEEDAFITLLANNQSALGITQGSQFCLDNSAEFNAVLALKTSKDLEAFVTDQAPGTPGASVADRPAKVVAKRPAKVAADRADKSVASEH
jgi:hypothetical protein